MSVFHYKVHKFLKLNDVTIKNRIWFGQVKILTVFLTEKEKVLLMIIKTVPDLRFFVQRNFVCYIDEFRIHTVHHYAKILQVPFYV